MYRRLIVKALNDFEKGVISTKRWETSTHKISSRCTFEEVIDYEEERRRNNNLKFVVDCKNEKGKLRSVITYIKFPSTDFLEDYLSSGIGNKAELYSELQRMKTDGILLMSTQKAQKFELNMRSDFSLFTVGEGWCEDVDCLLLSTKSKSIKDYLLNQLNELPLIVSLLALIISIIALLV